MLFTWNETYAVGIESIDNEHKALIRLINDLYEAMQDGSGGAALLPIFSALKGYTETHFAREERVMDECEAPDREVHREEHRRFHEKLNDLERRHRDGEPAISLQALSFLRDWLKNHIRSVDQVMAPCLKEKGLS